MARKKLYVSLTVLFVCLFMLGFIHSQRAGAQTQDATEQIEQAKANIISLIREGDYSQAQELLDNLVADFSDHPDLPDALYWIARRCEWSDEYEEAKNIFRQMIQNEPEGSWAEKASIGILRADILSLIISKNHNRAQEAFDELVLDFSGNPDLSDSLYWIARRYEWSNRYRKAESIYNKVIENEPEGLWASKAKIGISRLGILNLLVLHKYERAEKAIDELVADFNGYPDLPDSLYWIARRYEWQREYEDANDLYSQVIKDYPESPHAKDAEMDILRADAMSFIYSQNYSQTQETVDKLVSDFPTNPVLPETLYSIAERYERQDELAKAKEIYGQVIEQHPDSKYSEKAKVDIAAIDIFLLIQSGQHDKVSEAVDKMINDFLGSSYLPEAVYEVGRHCYEEGIFLKQDGLKEEAEAFYHSGIDMLEKYIQDYAKGSDIDAEAYYYSAACHRRTGQFEKAIEYYQKAADDWPDFVLAGSAQNLIMWCYVGLRDTGSLSPQQADILIEESLMAVVEKFPDTQWGYRAAVKLGNMSYGKGQMDAAVGFYEVYMAFADPNDYFFEYVKTRLEKLRTANN